MTDLKKHIFSSRELRLGEEHLLENGYVIVDCREMPEADVDTLLTAICPGQPDAEQEDRTMLAGGPGEVVPATTRRIRFHTDGARSTNPPLYLGLLCEQPDQRGFGVSELVSIDSIAAIAARDNGWSRRWAALCEPVPFALQGHSYGTAPVFSQHEGQWLGRFNVRHVSEGVSRANSSDEIRIAIDEMHSIAYGSPHPETLRGWLDRGELLLFDNARFIHSRTDLSGEVARRVKRFKLGIDHRIPALTARSDLSSCGAPTNNLGSSCA